jgi:hypothetical protein
VRNAGEGKSVNTTAECRKGKDQEKRIYTVIVKQNQERKEQKKLGIKYRSRRETSDEYRRLRGNYCIGAEYR